MILAVSVPVMVQEGLTNFVNLLDNLMIGRVGTDEMNAVSIVSQLLLVFNLTVFGAMSGAGIFVSQYHGNGDNDGVRNVFKVKLALGIFLLTGGVLIFSLFPDKLIGLYLSEGGSTGNIENTLSLAKDYLGIMLIGLVPFVLTQVCAGTLKETKETAVPMRATVTAVIVNLVFNYLLIFGSLGCPKMGVKGAAVATVISRFVECAFVLIYSFTHKEKCAYIHSIGKCKITNALVIEVIKKALPLMANELFWSGGMAALNQCYSTRGLAVVASVNIASVIQSIFSVVFSGMGISISIVVGNLLGANDMESAKDTDNKMLFFSVMSGLVMGLIMGVLSPLFPALYNTTDEVRALAAKFIIMQSVMMPVDALCHGEYFTLRSGGKTLITALFDSCYVWLCPVLIGLILSRATNVGIMTLYIICNGLNIVKAIIGTALVKSNMWMQNIIKEK